MKNLLLTGFGPFAEFEINPTESLVKDFDKKTINDYIVHSHILPVEYKCSIVKLNELIDEISPDAIINLGLAFDREEITPELIAINYQHSKTPDNSGEVITYSKVNPSGKESFFSTLPIKAIICALETSNIPVKLSTSAGSYVCNTVMYHCLKKTQQDKMDCPSGFIHIPPNLSAETLKNALTACINNL